GIRDWSVTGVQTCALPIFPILIKNSRSPASFFSAPHSLKTNPARAARRRARPRRFPHRHLVRVTRTRYLVLLVRPTIANKTLAKIGRASCRERVEIWVDAR